MGVPACWLNLDVLAYHIVAQLLGLDDVERQRLVGWGGVETVGPVALVECSELEVVLVVELQADDVVVTHLH